MSDILHSDIRYLKGVGEKRAARFYRLGVRTVEDLVYFLPRRYIDFSQPHQVAYAPYDENCAVKATVLQKNPAVRISGGRTMFKVLCADDSARLTITFFNSQYTVNSLCEGCEYIFYGKFGGSMVNRTCTSVIFIPADAPLKRQPVYPLTSGLSGKVISSVVKTAFRRTGEIEDFMPEEILRQNGLIDLNSALNGIHFPACDRQAKKSAERLAFDELFCLQLSMQLMKKRQEGRPGAQVITVNIDDFLHSLPYTPTRAQIKAIREILIDFKSGMASNRLLQGDVGSGKTLVAVSAMYCMYKNGYQSCMMAPTEILANQHYENIKKMLSGFGVKVGLLTASLKAAQRKEVLSLLRAGEIDILIGTHSVLNDKVSFKNLSLFITDEQHRFGVNQRNTAMEKGENPHILVMSATPIPRTLAMIIYADMKISVIDRMPRGRQPVQTFLVGTDKRRRMFGFIDKNIKEGHQAYIVLPAIEEGEGESEIENLTDYYENVVKALLPHVRSAALHGKMKAAEKDRVMSAFAKGEIDLLCSTTVVEVGVDVPNAVLMVIENAERYGLSALHQLRGRVGRGGNQSWCILVSDKKNPAVTDRLKFLTSHSSGFDVSQYDLEHRGPGDFFGSRQHGLPVMKTSSLYSDITLVQRAADSAAYILSKSPDLDKYPRLKAKTGSMIQAMTL